MQRKVLAGLLVVCWMILAGTDLLEDLGHLQDQPAVGASASLDRSSSKRGSRNLANNIVESAHREPESGPSFLLSSSEKAGLLLALEFRAYFPRHKLYRVFLI